MVFFYNICICYYLIRGHIILQERKRAIVVTRYGIRGADMTKFIYYLLEAEDTCSGCQPDEECFFSYTELRQVLKLMKTLFWVCIAVGLGVAIGNL